MVVVVVVGGWGGGGGGGTKRTLKLGVSPFYSKHRVRAIRIIAREREKLQAKSTVKPTLEVKARGDNG